MIRRGLLMLLASASLASAQQSDTPQLVPLEEIERQELPELKLLSDEEFQTFEQETRVEVSDGGALRVLDKMTGQVETLELDVGTARNFGFLTVYLDECRYPTESPSSDAFAHLRILPVSGGEVLFSGWMVASSPALMSLDHPRYDVWVLRCRFEGSSPEVASGLRSPRPKPRP